MSFGLMQSLAMVDHSFLFCFNCLEQVFRGWSNVNFVACARVVNLPVFFLVGSAEQHTSDICCRGDQRALEHLNSRSQKQLTLLFGSMHPRLSRLRPHGCGCNRLFPRSYLSGLVWRICLRLLWLHLRCGSSQRRIRH